MGGMSVEQALELRREGKLLMTNPGAFNAMAQAEHDRMIRDTVSGSIFFYRPSSKPWGRIGNFEFPAVETEVTIQF
jgi:hypothetical protein